MRFVELPIGNGGTVYINAEMVRAVSAQGKSATLHFDNNHTVTVAAPAEQAVKMLTGRSEARLGVDG
jgi:hypothetical protein